MLTKKLPLVLTVLVLLVLAGTLHGLWTNRWVGVDYWSQIEARLSQTPLNLDEWQGSSKDVDSQLFPVNVFGIGKELRYVHRGSGAVVHGHLVCGRSGPLAIHVPTLCYRGAGYQPATEPQQRSITVGGKTHTFWYGEFTSNATGLPQRLGAYWAWKGGSTWEAPTSPRVSLARYPCLYKVQIVSHFPDPDRASDVDHAMDFLKAWLPLSEEALNFSSSSFSPLPTAQPVAADPLGSSWSTLDTGRPDLAVELLGLVSGIYNDASKSVLSVTALGVSK